MRPNQTLVLIPTRNEAETIGELVAYVKDKGYTCLVIDDDSVDGTHQIAEKAGAWVHNFSPRVGLGKSLLFGWSFMLKHSYGFERLVQIDAGGSHDPHSIDDLLDYLILYNMVIGSRFVPYAEYTGRPIRRFLSRACGTICRLVLPGKYKPPVPILDWTSGYRAFNRVALVYLLQHTYTANMHAFQIESLFQALRTSLSIRECPITYTAGRSSFNRRAALEAIRLIVKEAFNDA